MPRTKTILALDWFDTPFYVCDHGWKRSGWTYGSKAAFTRAWKGGKGFLGGDRKPARLVNVATGEIVWESDLVQDEHRTHPSA